MEEKNTTPNKPKIINIENTININRLKERITPSTNININNQLNQPNQPNTTSIKNLPQFLIKNSQSTVTVQNNTSNNNNNSNTNNSNSKKITNNLFTNISNINQLSHKRVLLNCIYYYISLFRQRFQ
jgi:hypothetical protein